MTATADDRRTTEQLNGRNAARQVVANHYEIDLSRPLGSGGMAIVFLGRDLRTPRVVALRTLRPEYRRDPASRARFRQEVRRMASIQHANVAKVFDFQESDDAPWAVIEYVPGRSLKEIVDDQEILPLETMSEYLVQVADALSLLHDRGLVHLDIKPHNIIVTSEGAVKLIDFGLAQPAHAPQELVGGLAFGTAAYLSPEQASGKPVGPASDIYSLGCVAYELVTGQPPFVAAAGPERSSEMIHAHLHQAPRSPSQTAPSRNIPTWVDELLLWSLAKRPADRFDDVKLFAALFAQGSAGDLQAGDARSMRQQAVQPIDTRLDSPGTSPMATPLPMPSRSLAPRSRRLVHSVSKSRLPGKIWRLVLALLVANACLAGALYFQRGEIPGIYEGTREFRVGASASVTTDGLNVRAQPGLDGASLFSLPPGDRVELSGNPISINGATWWPVTATGPLGTEDGFVWEGGLEPPVLTGRALFEERLNDALDALGR